MGLARSEVFRKQVSGEQTRPRAGRESACGQKCIRRGRFEQRLRGRMGRRGRKGRASSDCWHKTWRQARVHNASVAAHMRQTIPLGGQPPGETRTEIPKSWKGAWSDSHGEREEMECHEQTSHAWTDKSIPQNAENGETWTGAGRRTSINETGSNQRNTGTRNCHARCRCTECASPRSMSSMLCGADLQI